MNRLPPVPPRLGSVAVSPRQAGSSYVAVLILVSILSASALTFVTQTGTQVSAGSNRTEDAQAAYLAEAGVNHAMWRLFHEPGFPPNETVYSMHSLGAGRYGYKVRAPTPTTFATIATVGVVGESVVRQSWGQYVISRIMTAYGQSATQFPPYRRLVGASWSVAGTTVDVGSQVVSWAELAGSPFDDEILMATVNGNNEVRLAVWNGASWGSEVLFASSSKDYKAVDVAYESVSGDALVAAFNSVAGQLSYSVWSGSAWSVPGTVSTGEPDDVSFVRMASNPKADEILLLVVHVNQVVRLLRWNGSAFSLFPELEAAATTGYPFVADVVYEQESAEAMVVWGKDKQDQCRYSTWDGTVLSPVGMLPTFGAEAHLVRAVTDPTSDHVVVAAVDASRDLNVAAWDGTAWVDSAELETTTLQPGGGPTYVNFDLAWESSGGELIISWARQGANTLRFVRWMTSTTLASRTVQTGPDFGDTIRATRMFAVDGTENVIVLAGNSSSELRYCLWIGDKFVADPAQLLSASLSTLQLPFAIAGAAI
jgi:hypothetical protein